MYISSEQPTRSIRAAPVEGEEWLILGGEGHITGQDPETVERYRALEDDARRRFGSTAIRYRWSAHDPEPIDHVPYAGRLLPGRSRLYVATGFQKWGFTNGTAAAMVTAEE